MFQFQNSISIGDLISFVLLLVTVLTVFFTYLQIKAGYKTQKAAFFQELYSTMLSDPDFKEAFYMVEYGRFVYDDRYHESSYERTIDRMLHYFTLICDLYEQKLLTKYEMEPFRYYFFRVYQDSNIQKYMNFFRVFHLTLGMDTNRLPYQNYLNYCEKELQQLQTTKQSAKRVSSLSIPQAYVFYEEQKSKLDGLLALTEQQLPPGKADEPPLERKLCALDVLIRCFQFTFAEQKLPLKINETLSEHKLRILDLLNRHFQNLGDIGEERVIREAIAKSEINDPSRLIIGLEALRAKLLIAENQRLQRDAYTVPEMVSIKHLF